jgi:hypothetical protein
MTRADKELVISNRAGIMAIKHLIARAIHFDSLTLLACLSIAAAPAMIFSVLLDG